MIVAFLLSFISTISYAAWPDSSPGRIAAVHLFRKDMAVGYPMLVGQERVAAYEAVCEMEKPYYPSCKFKEWTDENGRTDVVLAAKVLTHKSEPLAQVVAAWSMGFVYGMPSNSAANPKGAVSKLQFACDKAYAPACAHLGDMYAFGVGVAKDGTQAMKLYEEACKAKDPYGCAQRGMLYLKGIGVEKNYKMAYGYLSKGCAEGYSQNCIDIGKMHQYGWGVPMDLDSALEKYSIACQEKNGNGCYELAQIHLGNKAKKSSPPLALGLFSSLCELGDFRSCYGVGQIHESGLGVPKNLDYAADQYEDSCQANYAPACSKLGEFHLAEKLLNSNRLTGVSLIQKGCEGGDVHGCVVFAGLLEKGTEEVPQDVNRAIGYYKQGCDNDEGEACHALGRTYDKGEHVEKDQKEALNFFKKGCDLLFGPSCGNVGARYLQGKGGVMKNSKEALRYLTDGCNFNHTMSCAYLGDFYSDGALVAKDTTKALNLYESACAINHLESCYKAGMLIVNGEVQGKAYKALQSLEKACKEGFEQACNAARPIFFNAKFEGIVETAFDSKMCQVVTSNPDNPDLNKLAVNVVGDEFTLQIGRKKGTMYKASLIETNVTDNGDVRPDNPKKVAQSLWKLEGGKKPLEFEHHENWYYKRDPVETFPKDESFSKEKHGEYIYFSREREVVVRDVTVQRKSKGCTFFGEVEELNTEHCSEVQALLAAHLVSSCK